MSQVTPDCDYSVRIDVPLTMPWYFGEEDSTTATAFDFKLMAAVQITHALGFYSSLILTPATMFSSASANIIETEPGVKSRMTPLDNILFGIPEVYR